MTGTHLLRTGEVVTDLNRLLEPYGYPRAQELVESKKAGEKAPLSPATLHTWRPEIDRAFRTLEESAAISPLPEAPPNRAELEDWLIALRRKGL